MHRLAPSEKDTAPETLGKRLSRTPVKLEQAIKANLKSFGWNK